MRRIAPVVAAALFVAFAALAGGLDSVDGLKGGPTPGVLSTGNIGTTSSDFVDAGVVKAGFIDAGTITTSLVRVGYLDAGTVNTPLVQAGFIDAGTILFGGNAAQTITGDGSGNLSFGGSVIVPTSGTGYINTISSNGSNPLTMAAVNPVGNTGVILKTGTTHTSGTVVCLSNNNATPLCLGYQGAIQPTMITVPTCAAGLEGAVVVDSASGVSTGHRTRICICVSDGAGTPARAWQNIASGTVGTTTACND